MAPQENSHWQIPAILSDKDRFENLISEAVRAGFLDRNTPEEWERQGLTKSYQLRQLIEHVANADRSSLGRDLLQLADLVKEAYVLRSELGRLDFWTEVLNGFSVGNPLSIELIQPQGRCNYVYRLLTDEGSYVIRYHDPIGREFLPRYDPESAVQIYGAVAKLISTFLGAEAVCQPRFPVLENHFTPDRDACTPAERVRRRILVQDDYTPNHFLLSQYANQSPPMVARTAVGLYARTLARLHARTRGICQSDCNELFQQFRHLLRFRDHIEYATWIESKNWISRLAVSGWKHRADGPVWGVLLKRLGWTTDRIKSHCSVLWRGSTAAMMEAGSLLHSDYSPHNCFVDSVTRSRLRLFDFDYVFVGDPAYEVGLAANSLARLLASDMSAPSTEELLSLLDGFFLDYELEYEREASVTGYPLRSLILRSRAFAGLMIATTLDDEVTRAQSGMPPSPKLLDAGSELLRWLEGDLHDVARIVKETLGDSRGDNFGRALLRRSIGVVQSRLLDDDPTVPRRDQLQGEWYTLARDVLQEFSQEERMVNSRLTIAEDRPRRFFHVLPHDQDWHSVAGAKPELDARFRRIVVPKGKRQAHQPRLDVLLPVTKGYRRTFQSLACLRYDVEGLLQDHWVEFHVCVNFTDENSLEEAHRFARTMATACRIPVTLYCLDPREYTSSGFQWHKTTALNTMLRHIFSNLTSKELLTADQHYIHFADNDIVIPPGQHVLRRNIELLKAETSVSIVSAAYTSEEDQGFSAITSVRKRKKYVRNAGQILNLYGGCMTTTIRRLQKILDHPRDPIQLPENYLSEDCYLTIKANAHLIPQGHVPRFCAFANTRVTVHHPEPTNILGFAMRIYRDQEWGKSAATACLGSDAARFGQLRARSFMPIAKRIIEGPPGKVGQPCRRDMLALAWNLAIREKLSETMLDFGGLPPASQAVDWVAHKTQHQICKDILTQPDVYESVLLTIRKGAFGQELVHLMEEAASDPGERFPEMSWRLVQTRREEVAQALNSNAHLFHWYSIAEESIAHAIQFLNWSGEHSAWERLTSHLSADRQREICATYPASRMLENWRVIPDPSHDLDLRPPHQRESYTLFLRGGRGERFLRYYSIVGRGRFAEDSPRRTVYLHVLGERLIKAVRSASPPAEAPDLQVPMTELVRTIYPKLATATINYAGPEPRSSAGRLLRRVYLQVSIRGKAERCWAIKMGNSQLESLGVCLAKFLGCLHGITFGIRGYLDECCIQGKRPDYLNKHDKKRLFVDLLIEHLNHVRLFQSSAYRSWIRSGREFPGAVPAVIAEMSGHSGVAGDVSKILKVGGLKLSELWESLCEESESIHAHFGSLGYMGLYAANLFIAHNFLNGYADELVSFDRGQRISFATPDLKVSKVYFANHSRIAVIDPAVEAGLVLAELIGSRISTDVASRAHRKRVIPSMNEMSLRSIEKVFFTSYIETLEGLLTPVRTSVPNMLLKHSTSKFDPARDTGRWKIRTSRVAAFALLARFHHRREYDLTESERTHLVHMCIDLLHQGVEFPIPFR